MNEIRIFGGYNGKPQCEVTISGVKHVIEIEEIERVITKAIDERGFVVSKTNRQKFPRININD